MKFILRILLTAVAVILLSQFLPGVSVAGYGTAIIVAIVLALLNLIVKPILVLFTLPVTIITLGLFLLVINAVIILLADGFITGFAVDGFWVALIFSLLLSLFQSVLYSLLGSD
ncbi:putative membrane protein [Gillisia sp. Hel1_33_143]|uniref:phage holin family protein n=1 Tax=unclassified Gillisia TaxID=2615025 RepID=UPI0005571039|nr:MULTISPECIES: phage holin family protein [unclassified Gillisia]SDR70932.1 putative membrane protein [Gillisia sp. Hel1_33_143]